VNPVIALLLGVAVGGEKMTAFGLAGTGVVVAAVLLVVLKLERNKPAVVMPPTVAAER
jgi:drug/metabolite transporter (DMT)-like permease